MSQVASTIHLGNEYQSAGDFLKAAEHYEKCLEMAKLIGNKELEAKTYEHLCKAYAGLGADCFALGQNENAIEYYTKHLNTSIKLEDREEELLAYGNLASAHGRLGNYSTALENHMKSLEIYKNIGDKKNECKTLAYIGQVYLELEDVSTAVDLHKQQLSIATEIKDRESEAISYTCLGKSFEKLAKYDEAIKFHEKARSIHEEIGDIGGVGRCCGSLGIVYGKLGKYPTAIEYLKEYLRIAVQFNDTESEATAYFYLGDNFSRLGNYQEAKKYFEKVLEFCVKINYKKGKACSYGSLGKVFIELGKYQKAIEYLQKSLNIALEIHDKDTEGQTYSDLGSVYRLLGKYHVAKQYYEKHLHIAVKIKDRRSEGAINSSIGDIHSRLDEYQTAIEYYQKALAIAIETGNRGVECHAYGGLAGSFQSKGENDKAIEFRENFLRVAVELGDKKAESVAYGTIAKCYQDQKRYDESIDYSKKFLNVSTEIGDRDGQANANFFIGCSYTALSMNEEGDFSLYLKEAKDHFEKSLKYFESLFDDLEESDQHKIAIVDTYIDVYRRLAFVNVKGGQTDEALLVSERSKARALNDLLAMTYSLTKRAPASETSPLQVSDVKRILTTSNAGVLFYALEEDHLSTHVWFLSPLSPIQYHNSEIEGLPQSVENSSSLDGNSESSSEQTFSSLIEKSYETMKVREGMTCEDRSLEISEEDEVDVSLDVKIKKDDGHPSSRCVWDEDYDEKPLELLYEVLIAPVQEKLQNQNEVIIIPDGDLFMVPFPALRDPKTDKFLSETKQIRIAPSLTTLKVLQETPDEQHYKTGALIVGNPRVENVKFNGHDKSFINLPGAESEAKEIAELLGVQPLVGESATKQAVIERLQTGVSVIHFAAHGGDDGQIILAPPASSTHAIPEEDDYILTVQEAQQSGVRAQLVVLSCCKSGRGEIKSEGVVGMSRAFLAAGARAVVASLWAIDDKATKEFMLKFYAHLKKNESASLSLQLAMKEMRETEKYKDPKYWAAFFLIGDDVTIRV